jgi:Gpi18-like mannosyltransferase
LNIEREAPAPLPWWAAAADGITIVAAALAIIVFVIGGFALHLGVPIRVHSAGRLLFIAAAIAALRHVFAPRDPIHRRVARVFTADRADGVTALAPFTAGVLLSRIIILIVGYFAVITIGFPDKPPEQVPQPSLNLALRYDTGWYAGIALDGYSFQGRFDRQQNLAFFPAYPVLMRAVGHVFGAFTPGISRERQLVRLSWAGTVISFLAFAWAAVYFQRLARDTIGADRAADAVTLLAAYPFAVFFSAAYSESAFLLGVVAAFYHVRRGEFGRATAWGLFVGLLRPNGCFLSVALGCLVVPAAAERIRARARPLQASALIAIAAPIAGMLAYSAFVHHVTGSWFGWARLHEAWGRAYEGLAPATRAYHWISEEGLVSVVQNMPFDTLNALGLLFAIAMLWPVARKVGIAYAVFALINIVPPFVAGGVLSMGRLTATLFPLFLALAVIVPRRAIAPLVTVFAAGQGLAAVLFFTWRQLF